MRYKKMTYKEYSKLSNELSQLMLLKNNNKSTPKIEMRLKELVKLMMPHAF